MTVEHLSIVIPIHNEATFLGEALDRLWEELTDLNTPYDVTLIENGGRDDTRLVAERLAADNPRLRVLHNRRADYGAALRRGFLETDGDWVVAFDIDYFSRTFIDQVVENSGRADIVLASKRDPEAEDHRTLLRRLGTRFFNLILRSAFRSGVTDTHGMKAIRRSVIVDITPSVISTQDLFDTELILRAERTGARIVEVPAVVVEIRPARSSFVKRIPRTLVGLVRLKRNLMR
ncbi:MAG: glycosyltransferase family 2 protein [Acidimicrobiia bacterium]|nr:glycosyltransferase family 2 protein [Acidimicrobiia bacterium]